MLFVDDDSQFGQERRINCLTQGSDKRSSKWFSRCGSRSSRIRTSQEPGRNENLHIRCTGSESLKMGNCCVLANLSNWIFWGQISFSSDWRQFSCRSDFKMPTWYFEIWSWEESHPQQYSWPGRNNLLLYPDCPVVFSIYFGDNSFLQSRLVWNSQHTPSWPWTHIPPDPASWVPLAGMTGVRQIFMDGPSVCVHSRIIILTHLQKIC